jgi:hypothetical protein
VSCQCSPEMSCYSSSSDSSTSKLYLVPRRGWPQRMEMLPTLLENSPSSKHLREQSSTIWWTNTCQRHGGNTTLRSHSSTALRACLPQVTSMLFIANVVPQEAGKVMTLSPRDIRTCSLCIIKGDDITLSDSRHFCLLCINDA